MYTDGRFWRDGGWLDRETWFFAAADLREEEFRERNVLRVEGQENIPEDGAAIFASNHLSFSDSIFLPLVLDRRLTFLAKADYFTGKGIKGRLTALFFRGVGQIPIDRSGGRATY